MSESVTDYLHQVQVRSDEWGSSGDPYGKVVDLDTVTTPDMSDYLTRLKQLEDDLDVNTARDFWTGDFGTSACISYIRELIETCRRDRVLSLTVELPGGETFTDVRKIPESPDSDLLEVCDIDTTEFFSQDSLSLSVFYGCIVPVEKVSGRWRINT